MTGRRLCSVYSGSREDQLYLFVDRNEGLSRVPAALLERFGESQLVMTLVLTPERQLARADAGRVLAAIEENGYFLQLPPPKDSDMQLLRQKNEKLL